MSRPSSPPCLYQVSGVKTKSLTANLNKRGATNPQVTEQILQTRFIIFGRWDQETGPQKLRENCDCADILLL